MAPNFGAPNRRSPNSIENKILKLVKGFFMDFCDNGKKINWKTVLPKNNFQVGQMRI